MTRRGQQTVYLDEDSSETSLTDFAKQQIHNWLENVHPPYNIEPEPWSGPGKRKRKKVGDKETCLKPAYAADVEPSMKENTGTNDESTLNEDPLELQTDNSRMKKDVVSAAIAHVEAPVTSKYMKAEQESTTIVLSTISKISKKKPSTTGDSDTKCRDEVTPKHERFKVRKNSSSTIAKEPSTHSSQCSNPCTSAGTSTERQCKLAGSDITFGIVTDKGNQGICEMSSHCDTSNSDNVNCKTPKSSKNTTVDIPGQKPGTRNVGKVNKWGMHPDNTGVADIRLEVQNTVGDEHVNFKTPIISNKSTVSSSKSPTVRLDKSSTSATVIPKSNTSSSSTETGKSTCWSPRSTIDQVKNNQDKGETPQSACYRSCGDTSSECHDRLGFYKNRVKEVDQSPSAVLEDHNKTFILRRRLMSAKMSTPHDANMHTPSRSTSNLGKASKITSMRPCTARTRNRIKAHATRHHITTSIHDKIIESGENSEILEHPVRKLQALDEAFEDHELSPTVQSDEQHEASRSNTSIDRSSPAHSNEGSKILGSEYFNSCSKSNISNKSREGSHSQTTLVNGRPSTKISYETSDDEMHQDKNGDKSIKRVDSLFKQSTSNTEMSEAASYNREATKYLLAKSSQVGSHFNQSEYTNGTDNMNDCSTTSSLCGGDGDRSETCSRLSSVSTSCKKAILRRLNQLQNKHLAPSIETTMSDLNCFKFEDSSMKSMPAEHDNTQKDDRCFNDYASYEYTVCQQQQSVQRHSPEVTSKRASHDQYNTSNNTHAPFQLVGSSIELEEKPPTRYTRPRRFLLKKVESFEEFDFEHYHREEGLVLIVCLSFHNVHFRHYSITDLYI